MTAPSRITLFGQEYHDLLRLAVAAPRDNPVRVLTKSPAAAASLRRKMYEFFAALRASQAHAEAAAQADTLILKLNACYLALEKRITTPESEAILATLAEASNNPAPVTVETFPASPAVLERLAEIRRNRANPPKNDE